MFEQTEVGFEIIGTVDLRELCDIDCIVLGGLFIL